MKDNILAILDYTRNAMGGNSKRTEQLLAEIEVEAMEALGIIDNNLNQQA